MRTRNLFVAAAAATLLVATTALPATALTEPDFGPIVEFGDFGYYPAIESGPADDSSLVVYVRYDESLDDDQIYGQFVDNELGLIGSAFAISSGDDYSGNPPTAEWNPERQEWLVVWESESALTNDDYVAGRIVRPSVGAVGSVITIADNHGGLAFSDMELAYSAYAADQDVYLTVFKSNFDEIDCQAAFGVFVNSDGTVPTTDASVFSTSDVNVCTDEVDNGANVAYSPASSRWLVGWGYVSNDTGTALIENVAGVPTPSAPVLVGSNDNVVHPSIVHDSTRDRFLVSWHHQESGNARIYGALVDNAGALIGADFAVTPEDTRGPQRAPRVVYDSTADEFLLVNSNVGGNGQEDFVGYYELGASAPVTASAAEVLSDLPIESARPGITMAGDCVLVVWQWSVDIPETEDEIYGLQGRSSCNTPELAATGSSDAAGVLGLTALLGLALGATLMA